MTLARYAQLVLGNSSRKVKLSLSALLAVTLGVIAAFALSSPATSTVAVSAAPPTTAAPTTTAPTTADPTTAAPTAPAPTTAAPTAPAPTTADPTTTGDSVLSKAVAHRGIKLNPAWPKTLTLLTDSVGLGVKDILPAALPDWTVDVRGRPALMLKAANAELAADPAPVGSVAVVALGYNSLWGKDRDRYDIWAAQFSREADALIATLRQKGAKKIVWVTLRDPDPSLIPPAALEQAQKYNWYFPYVNEQLDALAQRDPTVTLADWAAVSNLPGLTYDAIHLKTLGAKLMVETIKAGVGLPTTSIPGL
ncbi:unannotated protein [freshwater metagenome]|uniref:Unannotated protein n=1 Tax=freshwater metagenome TaxID=449393 RepID=A0A6J6U854_9ZZZZ